MWTCSQCGETHEDQFADCWRCGSARDSVGRSEDAAGNLSAQQSEPMTGAAQSGSRDQSGGQVPIDRAAMTKGSPSAASSRSGGRQPPAAAIGTADAARGAPSGPTRVVPTETPRTDTPPPSFASELPNWDLLPPAVPIRRVRRQL
jgi:hypothetical protein